MRVYLAATLPLLARWRADGALGPAPLTAFAVTPSLREWYTSGDAEELEYAALADAARGSLHLLDADPAAPRRRVVVAAEAPEGAARPAPELDRAAVRLAAELPWRSVAAVHVDDVDAEQAVAAAAAAVVAADLGDDDAQFAVDEADDHELQWWATQEVAGLLGTFGL